VKIIEAAGAVVLRTGQDGREVLAIHRPRYDDWSLPKGKLELGELAPVAARREVFEEASTMIALRAPLDLTRHPTKSGEKRVSWWRAVATEVPDADAPLKLRESGGIPEVDELAWLAVDRALEQLDYDQDHVLLEQALEQPVTTPLILLRHAKAVNRKDWSGDDAERPLRARGRVQSRRLTPLLQAYGVQDLITSPWTRCTATMHPYALQHRIHQTELEVLSEDAAADDPDAVIAATDEIRERVVVEHRPAAICGHRPMMPYLLQALDIPKRPFATAECLVAHLTDTGEVHAIEMHRPRA
jgi:8-oxo-dGTP diphosphatase